jgi:histidyl-tRNA synthetase
MGQRKKERNLFFIFDCNALLQAYYSGPMFRSEKPQFGRSREFWQFGIECIGSEQEMYDAEAIILADRALKEISSEKINFKLHINTLGDGESRRLFTESLGRFFENHQDRLSSDSVNRLKRGNPLRILDSKHPDDQDLLHFKDIPKMRDYLSKESHERFDKTLQLLHSSNIPYVIDPHLVRGLDYYTETIFEFLYQKNVNTFPLALIAGGRYEGLDGQIGVGWAAGLSRLLSVLSSDETVHPVPRQIFLIYIGEDPSGFLRVFELGNLLRDEGFLVCLSESRSVAKQLKKALEKNALAALFVGEDEIEKKCVTIKFFDSKEQKLIPWDIHQISFELKKFLL